MYVTRYAWEMGGDLVSVVVATPVNILPTRTICYFEPECIQFFCPLSPLSKKSSSWYFFCPLTSLSYSLRLQWLQRRSRNQTSFFVGVSAASDRISKKENMHLLSVFPCLSFSYLFSSLFCILPSQIFQFYSNQFSTTSPYFGFQKTTLSYFLFCALVNLRD